MADSDRQQDKAYLAEAAYDSARGLDTRIALQMRYGTAAVPWFDWLYGHLDLGPGARVLDVGCGPGYVWHNNRRRLPARAQLALSDLSPGMVAAAARRLRGLEPSVFAAVADAEALPFRSGAFDAILALGLVDHLPHPRRFLARLVPLLAPGSRFYASAGGDRHLREMAELVAPFMPDENYGGDAGRFGMVSGLDLLTPFFSTVTRYDYADTLVFDAVEPVVAYVRSEGEAVAELAGERLRAFEAHLARRLAEEGTMQVTRQKCLFIAAP